MNFASPMRTRLEPKCGLLGTERENWRDDRSADRKSRKGNGLIEKEGDGSE